MEKTYQFLDIEINKPIYRKLSAVQYDNNSRYILVSAYSNFQPYDLTYATVKIYGIKKDKTVFFNNAKILDAVNGKFEIDLTEQCLACDGDVEIQILILGLDKARLSSNSFIVNVKKNIIDPVRVTSQEEWGMLTDGLSSLAEYDIYKNNVDKHDKEVTVLNARSEKYIHIDEIGPTDTKENTTETFAKARTLLEGTDKILLFGARNYYVSTNPYFVNIKGIKGIKGVTKIIIDDLEYQQFKIENSNGLIIQGLIFQTATAKTRKFGAGLILTNCTNFDIFDNEVSYFSAQGMLFETCQNGRIKNNHIKETTADGIHCHRGCRDIWISENIIENTGDDGIASFTYIGEDTGKNKNIIIKNNRIISTGNTFLNYGAKGISCGGSENVIITENIVSNCFNGAISIMIDSSKTYTVSGAKNIDITNNKILNTLDTTTIYPITLLSHVDNEFIENINIIGNSVFNSFKGSIYCGTDNINKVLIKKVCILNNNFCNCISNENNGDAVFLKRCSDVILENNTFENLIASAVNIVEDITEKISIKNNRFINCNKLKNAVPLLNLRGSELKLNNNYIEDDNNNCKIHAKFNTNGFECDNNIVKNKNIVLDYNVQPKKLINSDSSIVFASSEPLSGYWKKGDKVYYDQAFTGTHIGWVCVTSGSPGIWEKFGQIGMRSTDNPSLVTPNFIGEIIRKWDSKDAYIALGLTSSDWKLMT